MRRDAEEGGSEAMSAMVKSLRGSGDDMVQGRSRCDGVGARLAPSRGGTASVSVAFLRVLPSLDGGRVVHRFVDDDAVGRKM